MPAGAGLGAGAGAGAGVLDVAEAVAVCFVLAAAVEEAEAVDPVVDFDEDVFEPVRLLVFDFGWLLVAVVLLVAPEDLVLPWPRDDNEENMAPPPNVYGVAMYCVGRALSAKTNPPRAATILTATNVKVMTNATPVRAGWACIRRWYSFCSNIFVLVGFIALQYYISINIKNCPYDCRKYCNSSTFVNSD